MKATINTSLLTRLKPKEKPYDVRDDKLTGFLVRVNISGKLLYMCEYARGKRVTIGKISVLTPTQARDKAHAILGDAAKGIDPIARKQAKKSREVTLFQVFQDYLKARKELKPKTVYDYKNLMRIAFNEWNNNPLLSLTKNKIVKYHEKLGQERGKAYANQAMRVLRALFNFAAGQYEDSQGHSLITENPVKRLSQTRSWYRIERRQTFIKAHELLDWYQALINLENETLQDYLLLILFTGLRRQEAAKLKWEQVDLKSKSLTIHDTKNRQSHTLPLSDYLFELLLRRYQNKVNEYVFSGTGIHGYIIEPRIQMAKITKLSGIAFTVHDLRRTFITIAESLDIPAYALKRLLNHKMNGDVTAGYIMFDIERLRRPMQMISDHLLLQMGLKNSSTIYLKEDSYEKTKNS